MAEKKTGKQAKNAKAQETGAKPEKVMTKYDRKMEARKLAEEKEKREAKMWKMGATIVGACAVCAVVIAGAASMVRKNAALNDTYITVGEHELTELEYDYYFNSTANNYINTYYSYLSYMGLDTTQDYDEQSYSDTMTWKDAFDQMAVGNITEIKAVNDDAVQQGFTYDVTEDYDTYVSNITTSAADANMSVSDYYKASFGKYATQKNVEAYIKEMLFVSAYTDKLTEDMAPTDEEITAYYEENKNNYDLVDYHVFTLNADIAEGAEEAAINTAMSDAKGKAEEMVSRLEAGEDFEALCEEYAEEAQKESYTDTETEYSFHDDAAHSSTSSQYSDWLYDQSRTPGEITIITNTESHVIYVVRFDERMYDETTPETIKTSLTNQSVSEYIDALVANYEVVDNKGDIEYLETTTTAETTVIDQTTAAESTSSAAETTSQAGN